MHKPHLLVATTCAVIGAGLVHFYLKRLEDEANGGAKQQVLVLTKEVTSGAVLDRADLAIREVPQAYVLRRQVLAREVEDVIGVRIQTALDANSELLWTDFAGLAGSSRDLSGLVREGMRALRLPPEATVFDGALRPGDRVDVLLTAHDIAKGTSTLAQNLLVMAIGGKVSASENDRDGFGDESVTLSVTLAHAQLLAQAELEGKLRLVLRNPNDTLLDRNLPSTTAADLYAHQVSPQKPILAMSRELDHVR